MAIILTGGTGFIGSAVLRALVREGRSVTALVRSEAAAATVKQSGAEPVIGDLTDADWLVPLLQSADGAIHTAARGDGTDEIFDRAVVSSVRTAFAGTPKPYVHTGGVWVFGDGAEITEESPLDPPALTAWRPGVEESVLAGEVAAAVVVPGVVFGHGGGIPRLIADAATDASGRVLVPGSGSQHWTTVHVDDIAALYVQVLSALAAGQRPGTVLGVSGQNPAVAELGAAYARSAGRSGAVGEGDEATVARLGAFGAALLLDQQASGTKARALGWVPQGPSLVEELERGYPVGR